ncbi:MAG: S8 family serine peptidase, partial [Planctomycetota bacterium]
MPRVVLPSALLLLSVAPLVAQKASPSSTFRLGSVVVEIDGQTARHSRDAGRSFATLPPTDDRLHLRSGVFDPLRTRPSFVGLLAAPPEGRLFCVQARTAILPEYRQALESLGFEIVAYWPQNAYVVRGERPAATLLAAEAWVRFVGDVAVGQKLDPALLQLATEVGPEQPASYHVMLAVQTDRDRLVREIADLGGVVENRHDGSLYVIASLTRTQLMQVAALDTVIWIDEKGEIEFDMNNARIQGGGNYVESLAGLSGQGVRAEISEGLDQTHPDWTNPILLRFDTTDQHGHCTAGIVGGNGSGNASARGMMPDAQLIEASVGAWGGTSRFVVVQDAVDPSLPWRSMQQTASWGSTTVLDYTSTSADLDHALFTFDYVLTQSQSNTGTQMSR